MQDYKGVYREKIRFFGSLKREMSLKVKIRFELFNKVRQTGKNNTLRIETEGVKYNDFHIFGDYNIICIGKNSIVRNVRFEIYGSHNSVVIGDNAVLKNAVIHLGDNENSLVIGDAADIGDGFRVSVLESGKVIIGNDCMFSLNTSIMNSDAHSIVDSSTNVRMNKAEDVIIGNHVWFGRNVTVLKGVEIENNSIIGNSSLLTRGIYKGNSIYGGSPAHLLRGGVKWLHERI